MFTHISPTSILNTPYAKVNKCKKQFQNCAFCVFLNTSHVTVELVMTTWNDVPTRV